MPTAVTLDLAPVPITLNFTRGDTFAFTFTIQDSAGAALDLTGNSYVLTVNLEEDPATTANEVFSTAGALLAQSGATLGQVQFAFTTANWTAFDGKATAPVTVYCDLQQTDSGGGLRTIAKGPFVVSQDISK